MVCNCFIFGGTILSRTGSGSNYLVHMTISKRHIFSICTITFLCLFRHTCSRLTTRAFSLFRDKIIVSLLLKSPEFILYWPMCPTGRKDLQRKSHLHHFIHVQSHHADMQQYWLPYSITKRAIFPRCPCLLPWLLVPHLRYLYLPILYLFPYPFEGTFFGHHTWLAITDNTFCRTGLCCMRSALHGYLQCLSRILPHGQFANILLLWACLFSLACDFHLHTYVIQNLITFSFTIRG